MTFTEDSHVELPLCEDICRLCLQDNETLWNIFEATDGDGVNLRLAEKVIACLDIMVVIDDGLPDLICGKCMTVVRSFFEFRKQCKDSDTALRKCFLSMDHKTLQKGQTTVCHSPELSPRGINKSEKHCDQSAYMCVQKPNLSPLPLRLREGTTNSPLLKCLEEEWSDDEASVKKGVSQEDTIRESPWRLSDISDDGKNRSVADVPITSIGSVRNLDPDKTKKTASVDSVMTNDEEGKRIKKEVPISNSFNSDAVPMNSRYIKSVLLTEERRIELPCHIDDTQVLINDTSSLNIADAAAAVTQEMLAGRVSRSKDGKWICSTCNKNYTTLRALKKHISVHYNNNYKCTECPATFDSEEALCMHKSKHSFSFLFLGHSCQHCFKSFRLKHLLEQHVAIEHAQSNNCAVLPKKFREKCGKCVKMFYSSHEMETHDESCGNWTICSGEESVNEVFTGPTSDGKKCHLCQLNFENVLQLTYHFKKVHNEEPRFKCETCEKVFHSFSQLSDHRSKVHKVKHACEYCSKTFREKTKLRRHINSVHTEDRPYKCDLCGKSFKSLEVLRSHNNTHTKPFECSKCGKTFRSKNQMSLHENVVHLGMKDFMCERCGNTFINKTRLKYHMSKSMSHKLQCEVCEKIFCIRSQYQTHLKIHTSV